MSDVVVVERAIAHNRSHNQGVRYFVFGGVLVLVLGLLFVLTLWFRPILLAAYNVERAGRLMDIGLTWPEPRVFDSLPLSQNDQALQQALGHLAAAIRWQPDSVHAYRLAAQIYAARQAWPQAAEALDRAQALDENNALLAWERALVYEQIWRHLRSVPGESLVSALEHAEVIAPPIPIETPFCQDGRPESCYSARTTFTQPLATQPEGLEIPADVIFLHPPAELHLVQTIPQAQSTLFFLMGLDPRAREWGSDGAGFQVLVQDGEGPVTPVYDVTLDAVTVSRGWTPATVDLAPWAGKTITLILRTTAGSAHNTTADWYGWGNVTLLAAEQEQLALLEPEAHTREAWRISKADISHFLVAADDLWEKGDIHGARRWYERVLLLGTEQRASVRSALASIAVTDPLSVDLPSIGVRIISLSATTVISGELLQWDAGPLLREYPSGTPGIGVMWWSGVALAVVRVEIPGDYSVRIRVQDAPPSPTLLRLEHNYVPREPIKLTRGDDNWQTISSSMVLTQGLQIIGVRFTNDDFVNELDRNLAIEWLQIERK